MGRLSRSLLFILSLPLFLPGSPAPAAPWEAEPPLSTYSRWIVDGSGRRAKLSCVNWASHLEAAVAEGLSKQPVDAISGRVVGLGFNCVRLTWPLFLFTNDSLGSLTVRQSFYGLGLVESVAGVQVNNPAIVDLTLVQAYKAVVASLASNGVMIILDNHVSNPGWCCSSFDGNGFFGDEYFDPGLWLAGLRRVASMFRGTSYVVGMSLRNELRGPRQSTDAWYRFMQQGAEVVHEANPEILVILSGLSFDRDFTFLLDRPISINFSGKLVFETHWYAFSDGDIWESGNLNQVCGEALTNLTNRAGFLLDQGYPLFVSEFGVDQRGTNVNDNRFLNCFLGWAAEFDVDWALWTLVGSYYLRDGVTGPEEYYGILDRNWNDARNPAILERISAVQSPFQGPGLSNARPHKIIFHPSTGLCVLRKSFTELEPLTLGPCSESDPWSYTPQKTLTIKGTFYCLQAVGLGKPARLGIICTGISSKWEPISDSKMHLSSKLVDGTLVCLDVDDNNTIMTGTCKCLSIDSTCDPSSQWFKIIDSEVHLIGVRLFSWINGFLNLVARNLIG